MKRERRYHSRARKRATRQILLIAGVILLLLIAVIMPLLAHFGPLPDQLNIWAPLAAETDQGGIRWPWSKPRASLLPAETPAPTPQPTSFSAFNDPVESPAALSTPPGLEGLLDTTDAASSALDAPAASPSAQKAPQQGHLEINFSDDLRQADIVQQITYRNQTDRTLTDIALYFPTQFLPTGAPASLFSRMVLDGAYPEQDPVFDAATGLIRLPLNQSLLPQDEVRITLAYAITIPDGQSMNTLSSSGLRLADFYAYPAHFQNGMWQTQTSYSLPPMSLSVNVTAPESRLLLASGSTVQKTSLESNSRTLFNDLSSRHFALSLCSTDIREDRVSVGELSVRNLAIGSSQVLRINELSNAILQQYYDRLGKASSYDNITIIASDIDRPYYIAGNLIFYNNATFSDNNEFRYQFARALAELYFPVDSAADAASAAFNDLITHQWAAAYVIVSQGESQASFAYGHCPEAQLLSNWVTQQGGAEWNTALSQYRLSLLSGAYDIETLYSALGIEAASALRSIVTAYAERLATGAPAPTLAPMSSLPSDMSSAGNTSNNAGSGSNNAGSNADSGSSRTPAPAASQSAAPELPEVFVDIDEHSSPSQDLPGEGLPPALDEDDFN